MNSWVFRFNFFINFLSFTKRSSWSSRKNL